MRYHVLDMLTCTLPSAQEGSPLCFLCQGANGLHPTMAQHAAFAAVQLLCH